MILSVDAMDYSHSICSIVRCCSDSVGSSYAHGGICGSAFFVSQSRLLTAEHIVSAISLPEEGYSPVTYWLIGRDNYRKKFTAAVNVMKLPEKDLAIIDLDTPYVSAIPLKINRPLISLCPGLSVSFYGYVAPVPIGVRFRWEKDTLVPHGSPTAINDVTTVIQRMSKYNISSADINLTETSLIVLDCHGVKGNSGGPLLLHNTTELLGMLIFGLPVDSPDKKTVFAISRDELLPFLDQR